jgi:hypothetical protein
MEKIKFRAYHRPSKRMFAVASLDFTSHGDRLHVAELSFPWKSDGAAQCELVPAAECDLLQFTGLHDKNGKEIYEGDVVSFGRGREFIVEWGTKYGSWYVVPCGDYENNAPLGKSEGACKVIGNRFENPELLAGRPPHEHKWVPQINGEGLDIEACEECLEIREAK